METHHKGDGKHMRETIEAVGILHADINQDNLEAVLTNESVQVILAHYVQYLDELRHSRGQLASFWTSFLDLAGILLDLIRASHEGLAPLQLRN